MIYKTGTQSYLACRRSVATWRTSLMISDTPRNRWSSTRHRSNPTRRRWVSCRVFLYVNKNYTCCVETSYFSHIIISSIVHQGKMIKLTFKLHDHLIVYDNWCAKNWRLCKSQIMHRSAISPNSSHSLMFYDTYCHVCCVEELSDLRGQVKLLEEKNTKYMQESLELQEVSYIHGLPSTCRSPSSCRRWVISMVHQVHAGVPRAAGDELYPWSAKYMQESLELQEVSYIHSPPSTCRSPSSCRR